MITFWFMSQLLKSLKSLSEFVTPSVKKGDSVFMPISKDQMMRSLFFKVSQRNLLLSKNKATRYVSYIIKLLKVKFDMIIPIEMCDVSDSIYYRECSSYLNEDVIFPG